MSGPNSYPAHLLSPTTRRAELCAILGLGLAGGLNERVFGSPFNPEITASGLTVRRVALPAVRLPAGQKRSASAALPMHDAVYLGPASVKECRDIAQGGSLLA